MSEDTKSLLKGVISKLLADSLITAKVGQRVYSKIIQQSDFPYIKVRISSTPWDNKCNSGGEYEITVQAFSRKGSPEECLEIKKLIYNCLHRQESGVTLDTGALIILQAEGLNDFFIENDGITFQSIIRFKAYIQGN